MTRISLRTAAYPGRRGTRCRRLPQSPGARSRACRRTGARQQRSGRSRTRRRGRARRLDCARRRRATRCRRARGRGSPGTGSRRRIGAGDLNRNHLFRSRQGCASQRRRRDARCEGHRPQVANRAAHSHRRQRRRPRFRRVQSRTRTAPRRDGQALPRSPRHRRRPARSRQLRQGAAGVHTRERELLAAESPRRVRDHEWQR